MLALGLYEAVAGEEVGDALLGEEVAAGAVAADVEVIVDALALLEADLGGEMSLYLLGRRTRAY